MARNSICLHCSPALDTPVRSRIAYAFQVFAAIYDYKVVESAANAQIVCIYGDAEPAGSSQKVLRIPARYKPRAASAGIPILERISFADEQIGLIHGLDAVTKRPDWLGEIFEWISSSLEISIKERDQAGRIPFSATVFHQQSISHSKPNATLLMAWMENAIRNGNDREDLPKSKSPVASAEHLVVCSHDLDYVHTTRPAALGRFGKNLGISLTHYASPSFFSSNCRMMIDVLRQKRPGEYVRPMLDAIEGFGFRSTLFAVADGTHRRDPAIA
jgi:hypothetical protein